VSYGKDQCGYARPNGLVSHDLIGSYTDSDGDTLRLRAGGSATTNGFTYSVPDGGPVPAGRASWSRQPPSEAAFDDVELTAGSTIVRFAVTGSRTHPELFWYQGDPDECLRSVFTRA
jgi:hypothetical protein